MSRWVLGTLTSLPASLTFYKNSLTGKHLISSYTAFTLGHKVQFLFSLSHLPPSLPAPMGHSVTHPCLFLYYHLSTQLSISHHLPIHPYFNVSRMKHPLICLSSVIHWSIHMFIYCHSSIFCLSPYQSSTHLPFNLLIYHPSSIYHPPILLSICLLSSVHPSMHPFNYLSIHWSVFHPSSYLSN